MPPTRKSASGTRSRAIAISSGVMSIPVTVRRASRPSPRRSLSRSRCRATAYPCRRRGGGAPRRTAARWTARPARPSRGDGVPSVHALTTPKYTVLHVLYTFRGRAVFTTSRHLSRRRPAPDRPRDRQGRAHRRARRVRGRGRRAACSCRRRAWTAVAPAGWRGRGRRRGSRPPSRSRAPSTTSGWRRCRRRSPPGSWRARPRRCSPAPAGCRSTTTMASSIGGFSASGATIGPFVDIPGIDRRMLIADGKPANSEDLIVLWTLGLPYEGQHGDDREALARRVR